MAKPIIIVAFCRGAVPIQVVWSLEQSNVLLLVLTQPWRWDELQFSVELSRQQLRTATGYVYVIIDRRFAGTPPPASMEEALGHFQVMLGDIPQNIMMLLVVGRATILSTLFATLVQDRQPPMVPVRFVATIEQAYEIVRHEELRRQRGTGSLKI